MDAMHLLDTLRYDPALPPPHVFLFDLHYTRLGEACAANDFPRISRDAYLHALHVTSERPQKVRHSCIL